MNHEYVLFESETSIYFGGEMIFHKIFVSSSSFIHLFSIYLYWVIKYLLFEYMLNIYSVLFSI